MSEKKIEVKIIQPLEISETEGFEQDKLDRGDFGETLARILENQPGGNVFALDAGWGQGKTTFIKMWRGHVGHKRENKLQTIYFDAFANDYQKDILRVLTTRILGTIGKGNFFIRRFYQESHEIGGCDSQIKVYILWICVGFFIYPRLGEENRKIILGGYTGELDFDASCREGGAGGASEGNAKQAHFRWRGKIPKKPKN